MAVVEVGNNAVRVQENTAGNLRWVEKDGEFVTTVVVPDELDTSIAIREVAAALTEHFKDGAKPAWVESDSKGLQDGLAAYLGISPNERPEEWGN